MDVHRHFHYRAQACKPDEELKPTSYWIAVLHDNVNPETFQNELDFQWIKGRGKITVGKVLTEYVKRHPGEFVLEIAGSIPSEEVTMSELNHFGDNVVVLRALTRQSVAQLVRPFTDSRVPLQPFSGQPTNAPFASENPVQPVSGPGKCQYPSALGTQLGDENSGASGHRLPWQAPQIQHAIGNSHSSGTSQHRYSQHARANMQTPTPRGPVSLEYTPGSSGRGASSPLNSKIKFGKPSPLGLPPNIGSMKYENLHLPPDVQPRMYDGAMEVQRIKFNKFIGDLLDSPRKEKAHGYPDNLAAVLEDYESLLNGDRRRKEPSDGFRTMVVQNDSLPDEAISRDGPSPDAEAEKPKNVFLQQLLEETSPERLEQGVQKALGLLNSLKVPMQIDGEPSADAQQWLSSIETLEKQAVRTRTVIGVFGNTGAGKSSVINAMLDEERLVPTNCMRACTAVVTEMSWNDNDDPLKKYRAEIEFLKPEDWEKELQTLFRDLLDGEGNVSRESSNPDTEAGVAYAKIKAVYPYKTKDMLAESSIESLMKEPGVKNVLGTIQKINEPTPQPFYRRLQHFVDSKEKATGQEKEKKRKEKRQMEFWPLIKVVKIYTKSPALSTGAVVVDLPGVQDSNAARATVAEGYKKQCTGLWIVSPVTRAVDDKAAKSLLGDTFKRQLKYDGTYSNVTFICSKTDDISITEAADSLDLTDQISESWDKYDEAKCEIKRLQKEINALREERAVYKEIIDDAEDELEVWHKLKDDLDDEKTVYAPAPKSKKRKSSSGSLGRRNKRQRNVASDDDEDYQVINSYSDSDASGDKDEDEDEPDRGEPLTAEQIQEKIDEIKGNKKNARRERDECEAKIKAVTRKVKELKETSTKLRAEMSAICISGRNDYSKGAIQTDFAAGIKELDQENAIEEDEENFNPDEDIRDYDEVARSLPVFCVSSRAYQQLSGRLVKDDRVAGFKTLEETEIPQLQAHCKKLTEAGRAASCRRFLTGLASLLNSLILWSGDDGRGLKLSDPEKRNEVRFLDKKLGELDDGLKRAVSKSVADMTQALTENIFEKYRQGIEQASETACNTAERWGAHRSEGGLFWATYKATVRRDGVFSGASGPRDFNAELTEPLIKHLATGWERAFQRRFPGLVKDYTLASSNLLQQFHRAIDARARQHGAGIAGLNVLATQIANYEGMFSGMAASLSEQMMALQREANREFTPIIGAAMKTAYIICTEERGTGSFARMKRAMISHVETTRNTMFRDAAEFVRVRLTEMCETVKKTMRGQAEHVYTRIRDDYMRVIGGAQVAAATLPQQERLLRKQVHEIVLTCNELFEKVVNGEIEEPEVPAESGTDEHAAERTNGKNVVTAKASEQGAGDNVDSGNRDAASVPASVEDEGDVDMTEDTVNSGSSLCTVGHRNATVDTVTDDEL